MRACASPRGLGDSPYLNCVVLQLYQECKSLDASAHEGAHLEQ